MMNLFLKRSALPGQNLLFVVEWIAVYGLLGYGSFQWKIPSTLFFLLLCFAGLLFALYYGVKGALAAGLGTCAAVFFALDENPTAFLSRNVIEASFFVLSLLLAGMIKSGMETRVVSATLSNDILNQRLEKLTVELSQKDKALQEALHEVLTDMESPRIIYQALRRLDMVTDRQALFEEILNILYIHCHVEKSCIYEPVQGRRFARTAVFGPSGLPEQLQWATPEMPEIVKVAAVQREVIVPVRMDHRLVMAIPLLAMDGALRYVLLIEEVRFINFNENLINLLKVTAHWARYLIEHRLAADELARLSSFATVIAYKPELAAELLGRDIAAHRRYRLDYAIVLAQGPIDEPTAGRISAQLRLYDDLYLTRQGNALVLLSMIAPAYIPAVMDRLGRNVPGIHFTTVAPDQWTTHVD